MENKRLESIIFSVIFIGLSILVFFVFEPFLRIFVLAAVLSVLFHPLYDKLVQTFHGGKNLFAFLLVLVALIFLILPVLFFGLQIFAQAQSFFSLSQAGKGQYVQVFQQNVNLLVRHFVPSFTFNISDSVNTALAFVSSNLGGLLSQTISIFFQTFFLLFAFFFFLRDGQAMLGTLVSLSPFEKDQNKEIIHSVNRTITSVVRGVLFVGVVRFILFAAVFRIFGVPDPLFWAGIGGIIGAVPGLGTPFVIIPAFFYVLLYGNTFSAIGLGLCGILIFFFIDNLLSAYFFHKGFDVSAPFVLFSILGGIIFFGPLGFIFGPIILSLFISAGHMYKILILEKA